MRRFLCLGLCALLAACSGSETTSSNPAPARQLRVDWLGHQAFRFTSGLGLKVITNPHGDLSGLKSDVLLITTERSAYNNNEALENTPTTFRGPIGTGLHSSGGLSFRGVPTADPHNGEVNLAFTWTMDGVRICFAGNQAGPFSAYDRSLIGTVDVLFLPIGVPASLTDEGRAALIAQLHPRVIIPMSPSGAVSAWAATQTKVYPVGGPSVFLSRQTLPVQPTVLLLSR